MVYYYLCKFPFCGVFHRKEILCSLLSVECGFLWGVECFCGVWLSEKCGVFLSVECGFLWSVECFCGVWLSVESAKLNLRLGR